MRLANHDRVPLAGHELGKPRVGRGVPQLGIGQDRNRVHVGVADLRHPARQVQATAADQVADRPVGDLQRHVLEVEVTGSGGVDAQVQRSRTESVAEPVQSWPIGVWRRAVQGLEHPRHPMRIGGRVDAVVPEWVQLTQSGPADRDDVAWSGGTGDRGVHEVLHDLTGLEQPERHRGHLPGERTTDGVQDGHVQDVLVESDRVPDQRLTHGELDVDERRHPTGEPDVLAIRGIGERVVDTGRSTTQGHAVVVEARGRRYDDPPGRERRAGGVVAPVQVADDLLVGRDAWRWGRGQQPQPHWALATRSEGGERVADRRAGVQILGPWHEWWESGADDDGRVGVVDGHVSGSSRSCGSRRGRSCRRPSGRSPRRPRRRRCRWAPPVR